MGAPGYADVESASERIAGIALRTPLVPSFGLGRRLGADVRLKLECVQPTRAFKVRGAANVILARQAEIDPGKGVVAYSTGNHGRAVAYVAARVGVPSTVCMSSNTTEDKRRSLRSMGATVRIVGDSQDDAAVVARELAAEGYLLVDPINDPLTTAGQATIGREVVEEWPEVDTVVVPVSGGALMAGIALAVKEHRPAARLIGVSMDRGAAMHASLTAGHPVEVPEVESLADSLQGGITLDNDHSFAMVGELVDDLVLVTETEIAIGMAAGVVEERLVLEGAGAAPIAAALFGDRDLFGDRVALIASGAMVDGDLLAGLVKEHGMAARDLFAVGPA
jgi:threonine dehydratase